MDYSEKCDGIEECKKHIKNWKAINELNLDFTQIDIDGFLVDKRENAEETGWEYSLLTTMYTMANDNGRDIFAIRWRFKDVWGNLAKFIFSSWGTSGALKLEYFNNKVSFLIVPNYRSNYVVHNQETGKMEEIYGYGSPIFSFDEVDEITILSVELRGHQSLLEIPSKREDEDPDKYHF